MIYLCSVYSADNSELMKKRYEYVSKRVAEFLKEGITVFSPIAHAHPIAIKYDMPKGWDFWKKHDMKYIDAASEVWVLKMPYYGYSKGVSAEIQYAQSIRKTVLFIECPDYKE